VSTGPSSLRIDLVSDVVCPWCYIGFRGLLGAAALRPDVPIDLTLRAYQLDPDVPPEGADRKRRLLERFGSDAGRLAAIGEAVTESGRGVGIEFRFDRITLTPNTLDCHRLLRWASGAGLVVEAAEALFRAYFTEGEDLTQADTLVAIARGVGMDGALVSRLLASDADVEATRAELDVARRMGITGVPCFLFAGQFAVMGAQAPDKLVRAIDTAWAANAN
jgi:predicted DsbA family dithiol-disulfide isomerase